ncbi:PTS mannitol transporter subunit IICBA [Tessaracoccus caeni]|uniref:PTS mannitol transporter subunit IICBA n=1 Tax=Tessaracoccus caeni TaxID=3031239 RepID=UPI0023D98E65|nr:PTS mannitol transporter subunit IICBA [Tessaracoccus caeni]MDF1487997.1 PTS mannitol transporter subunit IICBA [Tessaracoccus caeni]
MSATSAAPGGARVVIQKFGTFLSGMIMPNIPALIAWGLLTAFFIPVGWVPNEALSTMVGPTIHYLLPLIIANTGGRMVYDFRGGVVGTVATMGAIIGSDHLIAQFNAALPEGASQLGQIHMFIGAMIMGPLGAWVMKKLDSLWAGKVRAGFEMLVDMFSAGITAFLLMIFGFTVIARLVNALMDVLGSAVGWLIETGLLPLASVLIEPAKVFFLNNAINHGVLTPLGTAQSDATGQSILYLLEANPGPGLGLLLAFTFFGLGAAKASAPGAAIIHFFGGIHEIYFPYVLMKPALLLAVIGGGATGVATNMIFGSGLRAPAAPGSFIAVMIQTAQGSYFGVILSVVLSATVSFLIAAFILRLSRKRDLAKGDAGDLSAAIAKTQENKGKKSDALSALGGAGGATAVTGPITSIVFACDAGMGSSAMGASVLRKKVKEAGFDNVTVVNKAVRNLQDNIDVLVTQRELADRAVQLAPSAVLVTVDNFMGSPRYDEVVEMVKASHAGGAAPASPAPAPAAPAAAPVEEPAAPADEVLAPASVVLSGSATDPASAISEAGNLLVAAGGVDSSYVDAMHEREKLVSTYMGNFLAIPHGTNEAKDSVHRSAMSFVRYPEGIDWNGKPVKFVVGIAGANNTHMDILQKVAITFSNMAQVKKLEEASSVQEIIDILGEV